MGKLDMATATLTIKNTLDDILPAHLKSIPGYEDKLVKAAMVAVANPDLRLNGCTPESILLSVMKAAELGLDPSGTLGSGYLIAYGNKCTFSAGYRGLIDLATRGSDSRVQDIWAYVVYENDEFDYELGDDPKLIHRPAILNDDRGQPIGVYMVAKLLGNSKKIEVMSWNEVLEIRDMSKAKNGPAWTKFIGQMARKAVIRRGMNYLPLSPEITSKLNLAFSDDDEFAGLAEIKKIAEAKEARRMSFSRKEEPVDKTDDIVVESETVDNEAGF